MFLQFSTSIHFFRFSCAYPHARRHNSPGSRRVHDTACEVCARIVLGREVVAEAWHGLRERTFGIWQSFLDCNTGRVVYMVKCRQCKEVWSFILCCVPRHNGLVSF